MFIIFLQQIISEDVIFVGSAESLTISFTLIFTAIVSAVFLKETIGLVKAISIILCILAVFCITQPEFIFKSVQMGHFGEAKMICAKQNISLLCNNNTELSEIQKNLMVNMTGNYMMCTNVTPVSPNATIWESYVENEHRPSNEKAYFGYILVAVYGLSQSITVYLTRGTSVSKVTYEA